MNLKRNIVPGVLKAVLRKDGQVVLTDEVRTAEAPARIVLVPDRRSLKADGTDQQSASRAKRCDA